MALNWSKGLQTAGRGIKEGGMLVGGMMLESEKLRASRLAASQAATLDSAQKAYKASFDNAYSSYKMLLGHRWKPITSGTGTDVSAAMEGAAAGYDYADLDSAISKAWDNVETARRDFNRSVGIDYKKKPQPDLGPGDELVAGLPLADLISIGINDPNTGFRMKENLIEKAISQMEAGESVDLEGTLDRIAAFVVTQNNEQSLSAGKGRLQPGSEDQLRQMVKANSKLRKGLRDAIKQLHSETEAAAPFAAAQKQEDYFLQEMSPTTGIISQVEDAQRVADPGALTQEELGDTGVGGWSNLVPSIKESASEREEAAVQRLTSQLSPQGMSFWKKYSNISATPPSDAQAFALLRQEFELLTGTDRSNIIKLLPALSRIARTPLR